MRLKVEWGQQGGKRNSEETAIWYASPIIATDKEHCSQDQTQHLRRLISGINTVGKELLPDYYIATILNEPLRRLEIRIRKGATYQGYKAEVDALKGFVECYGIAIRN